MAMLDAVELAAHHAPNQYQAWMKRGGFPALHLRSNHARSRGGGVYAGCPIQQGRARGIDQVVQQ
jgi:hypothetical protein